MLETPIVQEHRKIEGLVWAELSDRKPTFPKSHLKGSRAKGKTFERKIGRIARDWAVEHGGRFYSNPWIEFWDKHGHGWAQPDSFILFHSNLILLECKLTQNDGAKDQCLELYKPLLFNLFIRPIVSCQVFKVIRFPVKGSMVESFEELRSKKDGYWLWHYPCPW